MEDWREHIRREGCKFVAEIPGPLGAVMKLYVKNAKVVAETESGIPFIVPNVPASPMNKD